MSAEVILHNGRITTQDMMLPEVAALAISQGRVQAIGSNDEILRIADAQTKRIDLAGRRVIPGLN